MINNGLDDRPRPLGTCDIMTYCRYPTASGAIFAKGKYREANSNSRIKMDAWPNKVRLGPFAEKFFVLFGAALTCNYFVFADICMLLKSRRRKILDNK